MDARQVLEDETARFRRRYAASSVRFAEVIGRRVSHVASFTDRIHVGERRLAVTPRLVMFVDDRDGIEQGELERFAQQVAARLGDKCGA